MMIRLDCAPLIQIPDRDNVWHIFARTPGLGGDAWCHLVPGTERALLIDTGFGVGNLKGMVEKLTNLPVDVLNSHNHGDHVGGNGQFARAYIHAADVPGLQAIYDRGKEGPRTVTPPGEVFFFEKEDVQQFKQTEICPLKDGDVIDLGGGYEVEIFHLPGHSPGGIAALDRKRRMLFTGDAIVFTPTYIKGDLRTPHVAPALYTVEAFHKGLLRLQEHMSEFDVIYPGHSQQGLSPQYVPDMIACCEELMNGDLTVHEELATGNNVANPLQVHVHGLAKIAFTPDRIMIKDLEAKYSE